MRVAHFTFTGDSVDNREVSIVFGGTPKMLVLQAAGQARVTRFDIGGDLSFSGSSAGAAGLVKSMSSTGIVLGTDAKVNASGTTYYGWALVDTGAGDIVTGTYTGNNTDNRNITNGDLSGTPAFVLIRGNVAAAGRWKTSSITGDGSIPWEAAGAADTNTIQALSNGGFQVGTSNVNASGTTYYYCAALAVSAVLAPLTYVGNVVDNRSITGAGFAPDVAITHRAAGGGVPPVSRTADQSFSIVVTTGTTSTNGIQALEADGFQVGTDSGVNSSGLTYYALCLQSLPPATTVELDALEAGLVFGEPTVTLGGIDVELEASESGLAFGEPTVTLGAVTIQIDALPSGLVFGEPTVTLAALSVDMSALGSGLVFGEPGRAVGQAWQPVRPGGRLVALVERSGRCEGIARSGRVVITQEA